MRKVCVKPYRLDKMYMDEDLIEYKLYQIIDQFNERKITPAKFYSKQTKSIHFMMEMVERVIYRLLMMIK